VLTLVKYGLLLTLKSETLIRLMPSRFWRKVLVINKEPASEIPCPKVSCWRPGSAVQLTIPTDVRELKLRVDKMVFWSRVKAPPMLLRVELERPVNWVALKAIRSPEIWSIPLISMFPAAAWVSSRVPLKVEHEARAVASA